MSRSGVSDRLIPLSQVAELLNCATRTLQRKIAAGELPQPTRIGRESAFWLSDVEAFIARLKGEAA